MSQQINCPNCNEVVPAENLNLTNMVGKCHSCDHVFSIADVVGSSTQQVRRGDENLGLPAGIELQRGLSYLEFTILWRKTRRKGFFTLFAVMWNLLLLPFIIAVISTNDWKLALFISLHLLVGVSFFFYTLALWINRTTIHVSKGGIEVKHGPVPIPFTPNHSVAASELKQLYVEEYVPSKTNGRPDITFGVRMRAHDGTDVRLVPGFQNPDHALYIEQEIEKFLTIEDEPV